MPRITFIEHDGTSRDVETKSGVSVMEAARAAGVPGIVAECGGVCACATCQVYVDADWFDRTGPAIGAEAEMLEFAENVQDTSRLSCQVTVTEALDGLVVTTPECQV